MTSTVPSVRACTYTAAVEHESQCTQMVAAGFDCETWCATLLLTKSSPESAESCRACCLPGSLAYNGPSRSDGGGGVVMRRMCQDEACPYTGFCDKTCGYCGDGKSPPGCMRFCSSAALRDGAGADAARRVQVAAEQARRALGKHWRIVQ